MVKPNSVDYKNESDRHPDFRFQSIKKDIVERIQRNLRSVKSSPRASKYFLIKYFI